MPEIRAHVWTLGARNPLPYELQPYGIINRNTLSHDVTVSEVRWALEKAGLGAAWKSGHVLRKEAGATYSKSRGAVDAIPDGLIGIPVQGSYRGVALEVELHAKGRHRYRKVFESYRSKKNIWKIWYVVAHQKLGQQIIGISTPLYWDRAPGFVVYSLIDELVRDPFTARAVSSQGSVLVPEIFPITSVPPAQSPAHPLSGYASIAKSIDEDNTLALQENFNGSHAPETGARLTYRGGLRGSLVAEPLLEETRVILRVRFPMARSWKLNQSPSRIAVSVSQERYERILADLGDSLYPYLASSPYFSAFSTEPTRSASRRSGTGEGGSQ